MTASPAASSAAPCPCLSGLRADRCCALDGAPLAAGPAESLAGARSAMAAGDLVDAGRRLVEHLEAFPTDAAALGLLADLRANQGRTAAVEALLGRLLRIDPNNLAATHALAMRLFQKGALDAAEVHARNAVRLAPTDVQSHSLMGMILTEAHRPQAGEHHYRRVLELLGRPDPIVLANLAWNLKNQGRMEEARRLYAESVRLDPTIFQTLIGWALMEETDRNFARAAELLDLADKIHPRHPSALLTRAVVQGRTGAYDAAMATLDEIERDAGLGPIEWSRRGQLLDHMGRPQEAFAAFREGKRALRELTGLSYLAEAARTDAERLRAFFTTGRLNILPRAKVRADVAQPIFIVGFPRSGTTMVEQTLSTHPKISAGDELPSIKELTQISARMLNSPLGYPEALADLWLGDKVEALDHLRDYYLERARQLGAIGKGASWFTDKMPLNEAHLGLIHLIFPEAPVLHIIRHPLDVVLSVFSNHLTHGYYCAYDLESIAHHYVLVMDLADHYHREIGHRYLRVRYEDVVEDQEAKVREMLAFVGAHFDRRCLNFHENRRYARTASYTQVSEKLYDRSRFRWRAYRDELRPVVPILEPVIARLGYSLD
jgi:tetratricopeptide (TPR) repeat protein